MLHEGIRIVSPLDVEFSTPERWGIAKFGGNGAPKQQTPSSAMAAAVPPAVGGINPTTAMGQGMQGGINPQAIMQAYMNATGAGNLPSMFQSPAFNPQNMQSLMQRGMNPYGVGAQMGAGNLPHNTVMPMPAAGAPPTPGAPPAQGAPGGPPGMPPGSPPAGGGAPPWMLQQGQQPGMGGMMGPGLQQLLMQLQAGGNPAGAMGMNGAPGQFGGTMMPGAH